MHGMHRPSQRQLKGEGRLLCLPHVTRQKCWRAVGMQRLNVRLHVVAARACMSTMRPRLVAVASVAPLTRACSAASAACFSTTCRDGSTQH